MDKQLFILVGGNGAGKSTFYTKMLAPLGVPFVNADIIAKEIFPDSPEAHSYDAAVIAEDLRNGLLLQGRSFCFETVFSHPSKIDFIARAKALGYAIHMIFIHLDTAMLNQARVSQRVSTGGHYVLDEKVVARIPRVLDNVRAAIPLCTSVRLIDNSRTDNPFVQILTIQNGSIKKHQSELPQWALSVIRDTPIHSL